MKDKYNFPSFKALSINTLSNFKKLDNVVLFISKRDVHGDNEDLIKTIDLFLNFEYHSKGISDDEIILLSTLSSPKELNKLGYTTNYINYLNNKFTNIVNCNNLFLEDELKVAKSKYININVIFIGEPDEESFDIIHKISRLYLPIRYIKMVK